MEIDEKIVLIVDIPEGMDKPYQDKEGTFWVKSGADKRKATARGEIKRIFQKANLLHADEMPITGTTIEDIDLPFFSRFYKKRYKKSLEKSEIPLPKLLENMYIMKEGYLTLTGVLLFSKEPQYRLPISIVKAVLFNANDITTTNYLDKKNIEGKLSDVFEQIKNFIINNIHHIQGKQSFNSIGIPEIPIETIEELVANALVHRDYFISAPTRIFIFRNRVEIISPGHLPNNLTVENIKEGISNTRNPILASFANYLLPYSGIGSGITRALKKYPNVDFHDDREKNQFVVTMWRKEIT